MIRKLWQQAILGQEGYILKKLLQKGKILAVIVALIIAAVYYYVTLPAINIHAGGFWVFVIVVLAVVLLLYALKKVRTPYEAKNNPVIKFGAGVILAVVLIYLAGSILSSPVINAKKYQQLMQPETGNFTEDIEQIKYDQIPLLDKDSAEILGNRKMGSMVDMVSQF